MVRGGYIQKGVWLLKNQTCVIILHGLGRTRKSMLKIENYLSRRGYDTINESYPSTRIGTEKLAATFLQDLTRRQDIAAGTVIHFVTHSMGGILVRCFLKERKLPNLGRVVMLAPPNGGSEVVDWLKNNPLYKRLLGPAGQELGTGKDSLPFRLGPVDFEVGVIAGNKSINPINSFFVIKEPNDGKVAIDRTKVKGMLDFLVVNRTHPLIMNGEEVMFQTEHFLRKGFFYKKNSMEANDG